MNGGHGEWFVQSFDADGRPAGALSSRAPAEAIATLSENVIAGNRARQFAGMADGDVEALDLLADARHALSIPRDLLTDTLSPIYGRAPDAKLPSR